MKKEALSRVLHLDTLSKVRKELIIFVAVFFLSWILCFLLFPKVFPYLVFPYFHILGGEALVFTSLEEALMVVLRATFYLALIITLPFFIIQLWKAISSELYEEEKRFFKKLVGIAIGLGITGLTVGYLLVVPFVLKIFLYFGKGFEANLKIGLFLIFLLKTLLFSVIVFEIPLFFALLIKEEIITKEFYKKRRLYFLGVFYTLSLLIVPTDFLSQILLTLFFFLFFKLAFFIAKIL